MNCDFLFRGKPREPNIDKGKKDNNLRNIEFRTHRSSDEAIGNSVCGRGICIQEVSLRMQATPCRTKKWMKPCWNCYNRSRVE